MLFQAKIAIDTNTDSTDPLANPQDVAITRVLTLPQRNGTNLAPPSQTCIVCDQACTVSVYAADDETIIGGMEVPTTAQLSGRRFWLLQSGLALTAGTLASLNKPLVGAIYLKVTTPPASAATIWGGFL